MAPYIAQRLLWLVPVLLFVSLITFVLMHAVEGGPWDEEKLLPPEVVENLNRRYGLDRPVWRQYLGFVTNALQGDLGVSFQRQDAPVTRIIISGFKVSAVLGVLAAGVAVSAGVGLGVVAATRSGRWLDYLGVLFASAGSAVPVFVLSIFLVYVFGVRLQLLPVFGWGNWQNAVLPVVALSAAPMAYLARLTRASLLEVLGEDYMQTARAKGLGSAAVLYRHGLRNALIPVLTAIGPISAGLITGSFMVEHIFAIPGVGRLFIQSVMARDYGVIMGTTLFFGVVIAAANLAVDLAYAVLDPRIRHR
jgi:oligopeptide transport system permease protein